MQASIKYSDLDTLIDISDLIICGRVTAIESYDIYDLYTVSVSKTEKGLCDEEIKVYNYLYNYSYEVDEVSKTGQTHTEYSIGNDYIFILQHIRNVYEDKYVILSDSFFPESSAQRSSYLAEELDESINYSQYISEVAKTSSAGLGSELSIEFIESCDDREIITLSPIIALVRINNLYNTTDIVDVYSCSVTKIIKGEVNISSTNEIIIPFFKNTVSEDQQYVVCIMGKTDDTLIYTLSSKNSVYSEAQMEYVMSLVGG